MCACRKVAGASPGSSVKGRGCPVARCVEAGTFSALPRAPLCERYYNVTRATACFVARFCRPWGWGGVVRRAGAVFPTSGVVGQPTRGWGCRWPPRPLGVAVVPGIRREDSGGAAVAAASVPPRPQTMLALASSATWRSQLDESLSVARENHQTHYFIRRSLRALVAFNPCSAQALKIAVLAAHHCS